MREAKKRRLRDRASGVPTLINEGCKISGVISGQGDFQISGEVDGDCEIDGMVTLTRTGYWSGTINAGNVVISGHVEGDIVASGKVEVAATARITGKVFGEAIAVAEGAVVEGQMKTTGQPGLTDFVEKRSHQD